MIGATLIAVMGDDDFVCDRARTSLKQEAKNFPPERNASLIRYLAKHGHWTPFAHPQASFHVQAPIAIARQLFKSRVGFNGDDEPIPMLTEPEHVENEVSRRYVDSDPRIFAPRWRARAAGVKQGSAGELVDGRAEAEQIFEVAARTALQAYDALLAIRVAPEQARLVLPLATMTEWSWTGSLAAWARLYGLRSAPDAQAEGAIVARDVGAALSERFPLSWEALVRSA